MRRRLGAIASAAGWLSLGVGAYLLFGPGSSDGFDSVWEMASPIGLIVLGLVLVVFARIWFRRYL
jgi:hypothetical protein